MIHFHDQNDSFEFALAMQEGDETPAEGDACVTLKIVSAGFAGYNHLWVEARSLRKFCRDLLRLAKERQGSAKMEGMGPDEMEIVVVRSIDALGHMIVEGTTGRKVQGERGLRLHSITFGFEFDPSQLNEVERVPWVVHNAGQVAAGP